MNVFVAGTARSSPASRCSVQSAAAASGLSRPFVIASVRAPSLASVFSTFVISGVRPD